MDKWTHGLVQAGVASLEDENDEKMLKSAQMPSSFFDFSAVSRGSNQSVNQHNHSAAHSTWHLIVSMCLGVLCYYP
jgi:hypothetical protein